MLTKDEGGSGKPLTHGIQVLCYSQTWDCATYLSFPGTVKLFLIWWKSIKTRIKNTKNH